MSDENMAARTDRMLVSKEPISPYDAKVYMYEDLKEKAELAETVMIFVILLVMIVIGALTCLVLGLMMPSPVALAVGVVFGFGVSMVLYFTVSAHTKARERFIRMDEHASQESTATTTNRLE